MRFLPLLFAGILACVSLPALAGAKKHHPEISAEAQTQARHRIRLAAQQKKEWRDHLARLKALPRAERLAEKRHERKWQRKQEAGQEANTAARQQAKAKAMQAKREQAKREQALLNRKHEAKAVRRVRPEPVAASKTATYAHARNVSAHLAARRANTARQQALHAFNLRAAQQNKARQQALHTFNLRAASAAHRANLQAAHNARVAAARAHWIALHGDGSGGKSIRFWQTAAAGVPVKVISVDLNDPNIKVSAVMSRHGNGTSEPFRQMIDRAQPNVAVTGTFFSLDDLQPVGDIVIDGSLVHFGGMGTALCITPGNHADMVSCQWGRHHDWSPYDFVVACGPRLLRRGRVVLDPHSERFRDKHMLAPNSRIAVGITRGNTLFFVMTHDPIYLGRLARAMQSLGAVEAMNLDAGTSTGFYYNGATLARPGRKLTNMIVVYGRRDRYERALDQLVPASYHRPDPRPRRQISQASPSPATRTTALDRQ